MYKSLYIYSLKKYENEALESSVKIYNETIEWVS